MIIAIPGGNRVRNVCDSDANVMPIEKSRIFWASRRGMLELDLILQPFAENIYPTLAKAHQHCYEDLLACEDQDLFSWLLRRTKPEDARISEIVDLILASRDQTNRV